MLTSVSTPAHVAVQHRLVREAEALLRLRREGRQRAIVAALDAGCTERELAEVTKLGPSTVHKIAVSRAVPS